MITEPVSLSPFRILEPLSKYRISSIGLAQFWKVTLLGALKDRLPSQ
jgi:hypothetical protein